MYDAQFIVQGLSVAQPIFDTIEPADFRNLAGILVPPLLKLAQLFIYAHSHAVKGSLCSMLLMPSGVVMLHIWDIHLLRDRPCAVRTWTRI